MPDIWDFESDCDAIFIQWFNDSNAASIELDRGTTAASTPLLGRSSHKPFPTSFYDTGLNPSVVYTYTVTNWDSHGNRDFSSASGSPDSCSMLWSGYLIRSTIDTFESKAGSYQLLFAQETHIDHFIHPAGTLKQKHWRRVSRLEVPNGGTIPGNAVSLIQSSSNNFIAAALVTPPGSSDQNYLLVYQFDPSSGWQDPTPISTDQGPITGGTGAPALIQTAQGTYELFLSRGFSIDHFTHGPGPIQQGYWKFVDTLTSPQGQSAIQTGISATQTLAGDLEVIAHVIPQSGPQQQQATSPQNAGADYLIAYTYISFNPNTPVQANVNPFTVNGNPITGITGSPSIIQNAKGLFETLVPRGAFIDHFTHPKDSVWDGLWTLAARLKPPKNVVAPLVTAVSLTESPERSLEVVACISPHQGEGQNELFSYELPRWQGPFGITAHDEDHHEDHDEDEPPTAPYTEATPGAPPDKEA